MVLAVTFPGQGSQQVGMGKALAEAFPEARAVFEEVDDALGEKLSSVIFEGPEERLTLTANTQPALMAVSIAAIRALQARGFDMAQRASFVAGHSLGEYSALCAAGSLSVANTARLLRIRGNAMQAAVPPGKGAMAAIIGLEQDVVEQACTDASVSGVCQIANDNGGGQLVISGSRAEVEHACELLKERGAKRAIALPVSAPFHSALMAPAAEAMREALAGVDVLAPCVPLVANVTARPIVDPAEIRSRLVEQVTGRVRWRESVEWMADPACGGVDRFVEIGGGKQLGGMLRGNAPASEQVTLNVPADLEAFAKSLG